MSEQIPHDEFLERTIIATAMEDPSGCVEVIAEVPPQAFYLPHHALIWSAIKDLFAQGNVDPLLVLQELKTRGHDSELAQAAKTTPGAALMEIQEAYVSTHNIDLWAHHLREKWDRRRASGVGRLLAGDALDESTSLPTTLSEASTKILEIASGRDSKSSAMIGELVNDIAREVDEREKNPSKSIGISTGFSDIDAKLGGGLQPKTQYVLAGRPSMGKTALALDWLLRVALRGTPSMMFSVEMSKEQVASRALANIAQINLMDVMNREVSEKDYPSFLRAVKTFDKTPLVIDDTGATTLAYIRAKAIEQKMRGGLGLIVIDYLQLMDAKDESREREIAQLARGTKNLAKEMSIPVVIVSQLNRACESRADKRPMLSDLRESGAIEQDADMVGFVYRDDYYDENTDEPGIAEFIIRKNRNGPTCTVKLRWFKEMTRFESLERRLYAV